MQRAFFIWDEKAIFQNENDCIIFIYTIKLHFGKLEANDKQAPCNGRFVRRFSLKVAPEMRHYDRAGLEGRHHVRRLSGRIGVTTQNQCH